MPYNVHLHARLLTVGDSITAQLADGFHSGRVETLPEATESAVADVSFQLNCTQEGHGIHPVVVPAFRLMNTTRTP